jgi:hypothetical protein
MLSRADLRNRPCAAGDSHPGQPRSRPVVARCSDAATASHPQRPAFFMRRTADLIRGFGSILGSMRRTWATLLLSLFSFSLIAPAVASLDAETNLPACCRRNGVHHCSILKNSAGPSRGNRLQDAPCPSFPSGKGFPVGHAGVALYPPQRVLAPQAVCTSTRPQREALYRISYSRAQQKRGPPSLS